MADVSLTLEDLGISIKREPLDNFVKEDDEISPLQQDDLTTNQDEISRKKKGRPKKNFIMNNSVNNPVRIPSSDSDSVGVNNEQNSQEITSSKNLWASNLISPTNASAANAFDEQAYSINKRLRVPSYKSRMQENPIESSPDKEALPRRRFKTTYPPVAIHDSAAGGADSLEMSPKKRGRPKKHSLSNITDMFRQRRSTKGRPPRSSYTMNHKVGRPKSSGSLLSSPPFLSTLTMPFQREPILSASFLRPFGQSFNNLTAPPQYIHTIHTSSNEHHSVPMNLDDVIGNNDDILPTTATFHQNQDDHQSKNPSLQIESSTLFDSLSLLDNPTSSSATRDFHSTNTRDQPTQRQRINDPLAQGLLALATNAVEESRNGCGAGSVSGLGRKRKQVLGETCDSPKRGRPKVNKEEAFSPNGGHTRSIESDRALKSSTLTNMTAVKETIDSIASPVGVDPSTSHRGRPQIRIHRRSRNSRRLKSAPFDFTMNNIDTRATGSTTETTSVTLDDKKNNTVFNANPTIVTRISRSSTMKSPQVLSSVAAHNQNAAKKDTQNHTVNSYSQSPKQSDVKNTSARESVSSTVTAARRSSRTSVPPVRLSANVSMDKIKMLDAEVQTSTRPKVATKVNPIPSSTQNASPEVVSTTTPVIQANGNNEHSFTFTIKIAVNSAATVRPTAVNVTNVRFRPSSSSFAIPRPAESTAVASSSISPIRREQLSTGANQQQKPCSSSTPNKSHSTKSPSHAIHNKTNNETSRQNHLEKIRKRFHSDLSHGMDITATNSNLQQIFRNLSKAFSEVEKTLDTL